MLSWEKKEKGSIISHMETKSIHTYIRNRYKLIDIENRLLVTRGTGWGLGEMGKLFHLNELNKTNKAYS